jgi:hypothetical protein
MTASDRPSPSLFQLIRPWIALVVLATIAVILVAMVMPGLATVAVRWYLVGIATLATLATLHAIARRFPAYQRSRNDPFGRQPRNADEQPQRLREIDRLVAYSRWSAADFDQRLRPILYAIARQRLAAYRSVAIDDDPEAARTLLGERTWSLIAPAQSPERTDRIITIAELGAVVTTLEGIDATPRH